MLNFVAYYTSKIQVMDLCFQDKITATLIKCAITPETDNSQVHEKVCQETVSLFQMSNADKASIWLPLFRTALTLNTQLDIIPINLSSVLEMPILQQTVTELSQ